MASYSGYSVSHESGSLTTDIAYSSELAGLVNSTTVKQLNGNKTNQNLASLTFDEVNSGESTLITSGVINSKIKGNKANSRLALLSHDNINNGEDVLLSSAVNNKNISGLIKGDTTAVLTFETNFSYVLNMSSGNIIPKSIIGVGPGTTGVITSDPQASFVQQGYPRVIEVDRHATVTTSTNSTEIKYYKPFKLPSSFKLGDGSSFNSNY